jgi:hypothetical protein
MELRMKKNSTSYKLIAVDRFHGKGAQAKFTAFNLKLLQR